MPAAYPGRTLREITRVIFSRLVGIALVLAGVLVSVLGATYLAPWRYRSKALLLARPARIAPLESPANIRDRLSLFIVTQRELLDSDYVTASALMKLEGLAPDGPVGPEGERWYTEQQVGGFLVAHAKAVAKARRRTRIRTPGGPEAAFTQTFQVLVTWPEERELAARLGVDSRVLATQRAQAYGRHLLGAYLSRRSALEAEHARRSKMFLLNQATAAAARNLNAAAAELEKFVSEQLKGDMLIVQNMLGGAGETGSQSLRTRFEAELRSVDARLAEIAALREQIDRELAKDPAAQVVVPESVLATNPPLERILESIVSLRLRLNNLSPRFTDDYKAVKEVRAELAGNLAYLREELTRQQTVLDQEAAALKGRRQALEAIVGADRRRVGELAAKAARYQRLRDGLAGAQAIYDKRQEEALAAASAEAMAEVPVEVVVVDRPSRPDVDEPYRPILWVNVLIALACGLTLALVYGFLADHFDHTVKGIDDVERYVDAGVLASIPRFTRAPVRIGTEDDHALAELSGAAVEHFRGLWASLFYAPAAPESVLVCSASRQEGATTVACALAVAGATGAEAAPPPTPAGPQAGPTAKVALVDLNLRDPNVRDLLKLSNGVGVSDVLVGEKTLGQALQRVGPGALDVLTVGSQADRLLEVLRTDRLGQLLDELRRRYDRVIIDTSPVNPYPDARVLADLAGGVVLVAHCGRTSREALSQARKRLGPAAGKVLGVVLNRRTYPIPSFLYRRV